jgi:hypothetical protein
MGHLASRRLIRARKVKLGRGARLRIERVTTGPYSPYCRKSKGARCATACACPSLLTLCVLLVPTLRRTVRSGENQSVATIAASHDAWTQRPVSRPRHDFALNEFLHS